MASAMATYFFAVVIASAAQSEVFHNRAWAINHLGAEGLKKCVAFRSVVRRTRRMQALGGGTISALQRHQLEVELGAASAMRPRSLTPLQCGVPL
jgi:hypothetical protein